MRKTLPVLREFLDRPEVTESCELRGRFGIMAYHGGNLERTTDAVAAEVATRTGSSFYGVIQDPPHRHHIASTHFDPNHSSALARFFDHVDVVITVHGYGRRGHWRHLLLGGQNRTLARHVAEHLRQGLSRRYRVLDDLEAIPRDLRGQHPHNPVNRPANQGVQIELPPTIRWNFKEWGWSDHDGVSRTGDVELLIDALSGAVSSWSGIIHAGQKLGSNFRPAASQNILDSKRCSCNGLITQRIFEPPHLRECVCRYVSTRRRLE